MTRRDKPTESDFKTFWSVFEAKQARKREQLSTDQQKGNRGEAKA